MSVLKCYKASESSERLVKTHTAGPTFRLYHSVRLKIEKFAFLAGSWVILILLVPEPFLEIRCSRYSSVYISFP